MYTPTCIPTYINMYTYTPNVHTHTYIHIYIRTCLVAHDEDITRNAPAIWICTYMRARTHTHTLIHIHTHIYVHVW